MSKLFAIGLGPGDPELITLKAARLLHEVDTIFVPSQDGRPSLALRIAGDLIETEKLRELAFVMSTSREHNVGRWREHAAAIATEVNQGRSAAFVTEGDPLLYSTFIHVYEQLLRDFPELSVEIVPGVSSITAGAAAVQRPLGIDRERVGIVPATGDVMHGLATFDAIVILKVSAALDNVLRALKVTGRADQAVYVERAGWPDQRVVQDVEQLRKQKLDYFGQIVVTRR
ncbi:MAG: precorrin-2 C(20)-methyltransferase [Chloroflexi bacterium]|nr:precorrin-2 C(20)-methyltransferase [Chloroflexota bacterium]